MRFFELLFEVLQKYKSGAPTDDLVTQYPILFGIALGLATSSTCVATCGPVYAPFLMQKKDGPLKSFFSVMEISAGRFITYILFGVIAGSIGSGISSLGNFKGIFTIVAQVLFSVMLILSAVTTHNEEKGCSIKKWGKLMKNPFLLGIITGINFCPSFLLALSKGVSLNGPWMGGVLFFGFFLGSNVWLFMFGFFGILGNKKIFRILAIWFSLGVAAWFIGDSVGKTITMIKSSKSKQLEKGKEIVDLMDSTSVVIVGNEDEAFGTLINLFIEYKPGETRFKKSLDSLPEGAHILVSQAFYKENPTLKELAPKHKTIFVLPNGTKDSDNTKRAIEVVSLFREKKWARSKVHGLFFNLEKMFNPASCEDPTCTTKH